jgi:gliding motility-associated-like protein
MNPSVNSPVCIGSPINFTAGAPVGALVAWTGPAFAALNPNPTIASATLANAGNYTVTVLQNGCQAQQIIPVVVTAAPTVTATPSATYCSGSSVPAVSFTGTPANATFTWTNNQPTIGLAASGTGGVPTFTATNTTANPIVATVSVIPHLGTCNGTASNFTITVNPVPALTAPASNVYCEGAQFPGVTWGASAGATISWTNSNPAIGLPASGTGNIPAFTTSQVTNQTIATITATPSQGSCIGTPVTFNITVNNAPSATITDIGPLCSNAGFQTFVAATPGGVWSGPGIINTTSGLFNPLTAGAATHTITYTLNLPNQCPASDVTQVQVISVPLANAGLNQSVCQGQTVNLNGSFTNSNTGAETFAWTPTTNLTNTTTLTPTYTANSTQTYTLTVTSGICSSTDNVVITMLPQSNATITAAGPYCADVAPVVLTAAQTGGTWSGPGITNATTGAFNPALANVGNNTITYSIGGSCPSTDTQVIVIYAVPNGAITPSGPYCQSALPATLTAATAGGTWSGTGINNPITGSFGSTTLAAGTYAVTYTTSGNCPRTFNQNIVVNASTNATIIAAGPYCADVAPVVLAAAQTGGSWSGPGITNATTGAFNPALANVGNNTITYSISGPCPSTDTQVIVIYAVPSGAITPSGPYCQSALPVTLNAATPGGTWGGTGINNPATGSFGSPTLAANTYAITYTTSGNCPRTFNQNIVVNASTNATITAAGPFCSDDAAVVLTAAQTGGTWTGPGITNAATGAFNPASANTGNNTITYSIGGPCPSTDTQIIVVNSLPDGTITPAGPFCQSDLPFTLTAASAGGTWSGTGINNTSTGSFGSTTLAANTYTVTYNTGGNCPQIFTETIVVNANTNATITPGGPYCADVAPLVLTAAQTGGTWSGTGITNTATGAFNPASANIGNNTITYSIGGPCPSSDTQIIVVYDVPDGTITPVGPFCQSDLPITLSAASAGGTWSGAGINNTSTGSFGSSTLAANTYTVTYNTGGNCPNIFTETVVVNANVDATITPQANICADAASINFVAADLGGVWTGNGITDGTLGTFDPAAVIPGLQTITYTISGACPDSDTQTFEVYEVFDGTITPAGPFCQAELPYTLTAASPGGTWTGTGINNASTGSFGSTSLAGNSYVVTYTTAGNCPRVFNETIVVNANVDATISDVAPLCADVAPFNLTSVDPGGTWSGTGITDPINGTFDPSAALTGAQTITYTIPGSCPSTDTQEITVYAVYDGTIIPAGPFCQADLPITLAAASTGGTWSGTGINDPASGSFGSTVLAANSYTITYTTQGNCSEVNTTTIVVNANVDATISAVADVCNDAPAFNISAADAGGTWSGQGVSASGTFDPNSVTPNTYTITYSIGGACPDSDTQDIVVLEVPDGTITPAGPFCQDALPQTLVAASTGGSWSGTGITSAANGTFGAANTPAGNYSITYTTPGQCSNAFSQVVQVIENLDATIASAGPFCEDDAPYNLTSASPGGVWSGTGTIATNGQISPSVLGPGTYTFNYNIDNNGCLSSDNVQVTVNGLPQPSFTASATEGCSPLSVTFTNTSNPLGSNCVWYVDGAPAGNGNSFSEIFTGSSCSDIGIMVTDAVGCSQSMTITDYVCAYPNPSASFTWSPLEPMLGGTVSFENTSIGGITFDWDINGQGASGENVTYTVPSEVDGEFQACLQIEGQGGCLDTQCYTVVLSSEAFIFVPNSFTPDADGTNDVFAPIIAGLTSDYRYSFRVYDRWGEVIFETNDPSDVWTGNVRGGDYYAQPDAYVYEITLQLRAGEVPFRKVGTIILIR